MSVFTKPDSFTKQIAIFLNAEEYSRAYDLSKEMVEKFPNELIAHFLLAKSSFWLENYQEAAGEGQKAFNKAETKEDMMICAVFISSAQFMLGKYDAGYKLLRLFEKDKNEDVERMLFIFSTAMEDKAAASHHANELMKINKKAALKLIERFI
jgi:cytochrome c-type biogenesis protein CcmH/NrfG